MILLVLVSIPVGIFLHAQCWHDWSKWEEPGGAYRVEQVRHCQKCNLYQYTEVIR